MLAGLSLSRMDIIIMFSNIIIIACLWSDCKLWSNHKLLLFREIMENYAQLIFQLFCICTCCSLSGLLVLFSTAWWSGREVCRGRFWWQKYMEEIWNGIKRLSGSEGNGGMNSIPMKRIGHRKLIEETSGRRVEEVRGGS